MALREYRARLNYFEKVSSTVDGKFGLVVRNFFVGGGLGLSVAVSNDSAAYLD